MMLILLFLLPSSALAAPNPQISNLKSKISFSQPKKITTYAGENFAPALSPDGTRLAFVSNRQGNADIYVKTLNEVGAREVPLTHYSGVDKSPAWAPDGKRLAFVSHGEDPDGDIYLLDLTQPEETRQPKRLTQIETADASPVWFPDGNAITFSSRLKEEELPNLWQLDLATGVKKQITQNGGSMPSVSPDGKYLAFVTLNQNPNGNISLLRLSDGRIVTWTEGKEANGFPAWDPGGKKIYFSRCAEDTDLDGELTFLDNPSIWAGDFYEDIFSQAHRPAEFRQLTSGDTYDIFPIVHGETLYFASSPQPPGFENRAIHILAIPKTGLFPPVSGVEAVQKMTEETETASSYIKLMILRDILYDLSPFQDPALPASLHYKMGKTYQDMNNSQQALESFATLIRAFPQARLATGLAKVESVVISTPGDMATGPAQAKESIAQGIQQLKKLAEEFKDMPKVSGAALLRMGDFHLLLKEHEQAMAVYDRVAREFKEEREIAAESWTSKSKIYLDLGNGEKLEEAFLNVLREFPDVPPWTRKATEEILRINTASGPTNKKTERLYHLADEYPTLPFLPAAALNLTGELYYSDHENLKAKQAYLRVVEKFPHEKEETSKAKFALAKIYFEEEDFDSTFRIYRELDIDPASAFQSRREFMEKLLSKGERELSTGEARLAVKTFKSIIDYDTLIIEAHRGLVQSHAALNEAAKTVDHYQKEVARLEKESPPPSSQLSAAYYTLGLALTYLQPPRLEESAKQIQRAVALNGNEPFYFQTLGWLHEQKYQAAGDNHYLELAADAYQTAISLNLDQGLAKSLPDLWLNMGNAQYLIQNYGGAYAQYKKRLESRTPFGTGQEARTRESIYFQRFGEVSFKLGKSGEAVEYFAKALPLLEGPEQEKNQKRMAEIHARIALVYQDTGEYEKAVEYFSRALEIHQKTGDRRNVAITLRNMANNLYFSTRQRKTDEKASQVLHNALNRYFETIRLMEKGELEPPKKKKKRSALIQIDVEQGLDEESSRAAFGFSKTDEEKLIFNYIGKIYSDFREYPKAVEYFKKKLALSPADLPLEGNVPLLLERAIIENQIGNYLYLSGNRGEAADYFRRSLEGSTRLKNLFGMAVNALNLGRLFAESFLTHQKTEGKSLRDVLPKLQSVGEVLAKKPEYKSNGAVVQLKNLTGILAFSLSQMESGKTPTKQEKDVVSAVKSSLVELNQDYTYLRQAQRSFQKGLDILSQLAPGSATFSIAAAQAVLQHNLKTAHGDQQISDFKSRISDSKSQIQNLKSQISNPKCLLPPSLQWQLTFLSAATATSDEAEIEILALALKELEEIPYGLRIPDAVEREMAEELFGRLAWMLMKSGKAQEAFFAAERGREWELRAGHEGVALSFKDSNKSEFYNELKKISSEIRKLYSRLEVSHDPGKVEEIHKEILQSKAAYADTMEKIREDFADLASLFQPDPPEEVLGKVQSILETDEALVRTLRYRNALLEWVITAEDIKSAMNPFPSSWENYPMATDLSSFQRLYFVMDETTLQIPFSNQEVSHIASLSHLVRSHAQQNLNTSNLLLAGRGVGDVDSLGKTYRGLTLLAPNSLTKSAFLAESGKNGVVNLDSPTVMIPRDPAHSYLSLTGTENMADRLELHQLYGMEEEAYLLSLPHMDGTSLSPINLAILVDALSRAGYPYLLINTGAPDDPYREKLLSTFFENLRSHPPTEALLLARKAASQSFPHFALGVHYKVFGYGGMREEERVAFAEEHLQSSIQQGMAAAKEKDWPAAIKNFEHALSLLDAMDEKKYRDILYKQLVSAAVKLNDYGKAIIYQKSLVEITEELNKPKESADAIHYLGYLYYKAEDFTSAITYTQKAIAIYQENGLKDKMAEAYQRLGIAREKTLDYQSALEAHGVSRQLSAESGKSLDEGKQLNWIGSILLLRLNAYGEAMDHFKEALVILESQKAWKDALESLLGVGRAYQAQGHFKEALDYFQQAMDLIVKEKLDAKWAECQLDFANTYWFQGDYQKAFVALSAALERAEKDQDVRTQTFITSTMGLIFWTLNDYQRSLDNLEKSLQLAQGIKSDLDIASANNNMGLVHRDSGRYEEALKYFGQALEMDTQINSRWGLGYDHRNMGMAYLKMNNLEKASEHVELAYKISREINDRVNMVKALLERGNIALKKGKFAEASGLFQETFTLADTINVKEVQWRALMGEARAMVGMGQRVPAIEKFKEGVAVVEGMRSSIKVEELRNGFAENKGELYEELIIQLLNDGQAREAFNFSERARARSFIDLLGSQKISLKNSVDQEDFEKLQRLKILVEDTEGRMKTEEEEGRRKRLAKELRMQRDKYGDTLIELKSKNPQLSNFVTVDPLKIEEVYSLLEPETTLLEYAVTEKETVVWVVKKGSIQVARVPVEKSKLTALVKDFRGRMQSLAPMEDVSRELHALLIKPVEKELAGSPLVGLIPHSVLHYLSFSALRDGEGFLVERYPLFYLPSASLMKFTVREKVRAIPKETKVLAIGNPDLEDLNYDLPLAEMEANALRWDFPRIDILTGEKARESWVAEHIGDYDIIHIASHGEFDPVNPLFSSLKLTRDLESDGNLEVNEVFSLEINANLVTLSACQTGLGKITGGDELIGLNRAFFYAGASSLISSLWRVSDVSTAVLIKHFYRNYGFMAKAEALRKAQLQVKRYYPHPSYWSGFSLTGNYH